MDCSPPGFSVHKLFQGRMLAWVAISFSRKSSQPRGRTCVSHFGRWMDSLPLSHLGSPFLTHLSLKQWNREFFGCPVFQFSCSVVSDSLRPHESQQPGLPVHHQLPEFTQTHVHRVSHAIQSSHPLSSPSPPAPNPSQHQSLFQWVNSSHEVAKVLEFQL